MVDNGSGLFKIQIKSTTKIPEKNSVTTIKVNLENSKRVYSKHNVDYFAIYVYDFDGFFIIKNKGKMQSVRLSMVGKYSKNFNNFVFERDSSTHS